MPITNDNGDVAIKYLQEVPHIVTIRGYNYAFVVKRNVNLTWVKPGDVASMLAIKKDCGCPANTKKQKYVYANELDVQRWMS